MRTIIAAVTLLFTTLVHAEFLPEGCYVTYANPGQCWSGSDGVTEWIVSTDRDLTEYRYGTAVESIMYQWAGYKSLYEATELNRQEWITYGTAKEASRATLASTVSKRDALIKKLRKACGSRCKKIK